MLSESVAKLASCTSLKDAIFLLTESEYLQAIYPSGHPTSTVVGAWWTELVYEVMCTTQQDVVLS